MNEKFLKSLQEILTEEEFLKYLKSMNDNPKKSFRVNTYKLKNSTNNDTVSQNAFINNTLSNFAAKNNIVDTMYHIDNDVKLGNEWFHKAGVIYIQEPSSTMAVEILKRADDFIGKRVLDVCAAPGGKTSQLAEMVGEDGFVLSNEVNFKRVNILRSNVERLGYVNVAVSSCEVGVLKNNLQNTFDAVLVDAPCSGEGMFRKDENAQREWSENEVLRNADLQYNILTNASNCVKNGGYLVYSTCTFNIRENEEVVLKFIKNNPSFKIVKVCDDINKISKDGIVLEEFKDLKYARRFYPFDNFGEGQFVCLMKNILKEESVKTTLKPTLKSIQEKKVVENFLNINFDLEKANLTQLGNLYFLYNNNFPELKNIPLLTCGVAVAEIDKKIVKPHHNLFTALGFKCKNILNLTSGDERVFKFYKGEQIEGSVLDGYCAINVDGFCIGFGKSKNGTINNHYPKGLRQ